MNETLSLSSKRSRAAAARAAFPSRAATSAPAILKILQCSNLGGMEKATMPLLRTLAEKDSFRFRILTPRPFGLSERQLRNIDPLCQDFQYKGRFGWRTFSRFRRRIRELARESSCIWLTGTCACSLAAIRNLPGKKVLGHHYHHFGERGAAVRWFAFYHALCRELDIVTYPTDFTRNEALRIVPWMRRNTHVVRYGFPVHYTNETERRQRQTAARRRLNLPQDAWIVGNGGWLISRKRFDIFLETARRVRDRIPNAFFVICGNGPLEEKLKIRVSRLNLSNAVRFTGWVEDLDLYYQAWDVCLFNSDLDALGRTPMEAAAHGCLVAASVRYGGLGEFLTHGENGIFYTSHDSDLLAREIAALAANPARAEALRAAAAEKLRISYSPQRAAAFYKSIFSE